MTITQPLGESYAGNVITFKIGDVNANEPATWQQGQTNELDLSASSSALIPAPSNRPGPSGSELAETNIQVSAGTPLASPPAQPSVFQGTATVDGVLVPQGTIVTAWVGNTEVGIASVAPRPAIPDSLGRAGVYFGPLGTNLRRAWSYDTTIQLWYFYDPRAAFADTNTLAEVLSGSIVWLDVSEDVDFKSLSLYEGWNLVPLP